MDYRVSYEPSLKSEPDAFIVQIPSHSGGDSKRQAVAAIREKVNIAERRACRLVGLSRSVLRYDAKQDHENEVLAVRLVELAHERRRFGYA